MRLEETVVPGMVEFGLTVGREIGLIAATTALAAPTGGGSLMLNVVRYGAMGVKGGLLVRDAYLSAQSFNTAYNDLQAGNYAAAAGNAALGFVGLVGVRSLGKSLADDVVRLRGANSIVTDFASEGGELGGRLYGDKKLGNLKNYLGRRGVSLEVGSPNLRQGMAGEFTAFPDGTARLLLKANPTNELVWHELAHFIHWRRLGPDAYRALPRVVGNNVPEQFVFNLLERPERWIRLSSEYRLHMVDYITRTWGGMGR